MYQIICTLNNITGGVTEVYIFLSEKKGAWQIYVTLSIQNFRIQQPVFNSYLLISIYYSACYTLQMRDQISQYQFITYWGQLIYQFYRCRHS